MLIYYVLFFFRNHYFDESQRKRRKGKRKAATISAPSQPSKGARGVRQYHRTDESKIQPHVRLGIDLDEDMIT